MQLFCLLVALCIVCYAVCANEPLTIAGGGRTYAKQKRLCRKKNDAASYHYACCIYEYAKANKNT